jgi:hypothetical protein
MFSCEVVLAAVLLSAPKDVPASQTQAEWIEATRSSLLTLAIDGEILDPRERAFLITQDPAGDLTMLRGRNEEFARAPRLGECQRFPERKLVNDFLALNRSYRNDLNARLTIDLIHMEELRAAIMETDQLYHVWDTVRDARCDYYYVTVRRQSLQLLRDLIGAEAFYSGQMPPNVPVWHFPRGQ